MENIMDNKLPKIRRITFFVVLSVAVLIVLAALFSMLVYGDKTVLYIKPTDLHPLDNPYMGYVSTSTETDAKLTYIELTWAELEPAEGFFDFDGIKAKYKFDELRAKGTRVVLRFICDRPGETDHIDIPEWLYARTPGEHYDNAYGKGFSPDYSDMNFMKAHNLAITALGKEYGGDDFFTYIEIGSVGHNGTFKVSDEIDISIDNYLLENYVEDYINVFKNSILLTPGSSYFTEEYGLGEYNPNIADGFDEFNKGSVFGAHILDKKSDYSAVLDGRGLSFLVSDSRPSDAELSKVGYVLKVTEANASLDKESDNLTINMTFENSGAAAFPEDRLPVLYFINSRGKIIVKFPLSLHLDTIAPGQQVNVEKTVNLSAFTNERTLRLCVGVQDAITEEPFVAFGMEDELQPYLYNFGSVSI
jgi:hypothetical protein